MTSLFCYVPLQTLSCVLTCVPSSMVWSVKSISGTGFLSMTARSICASMLLTARVLQARLLCRRCFRNLFAVGLV